MTRDREIRPTDENGADSNNTTVHPDYSRSPGDPITTLAEAQAVIADMHRRFDAVAAARVPRLYVVGGPHDPATRERESFDVDAFDDLVDAALEAGDHRV